MNTELRVALSATGADDIVNFEGTRLAMTRVIAVAQRELQILSPYLDEVGAEFLSAPLAVAIERGVTGTLVVRSGRGDLDPNKAGLRALARHVGPDLLSQSFRVVQLAETDDVGSPYGTHAKVIVADRSSAYIGSANLTKNGLDRNTEIGVVIEGMQLAAIASLVERLAVRPSVRHLSWTALAR